MQQEFCTVGRAHACNQVCSSVFDPLILGLQDLDGLGLDAEEMACKIGGEPLQRLPF